MKLHLGCWKRDFGNGWIHIDIADYPHIDYKHSVDNLPMIEDESADLIYASHVIEYFDRGKAIDVLKEWKRALKKGGILRLAVPDFEAIAKLYIKKGFKLDSFLGPLYGKMNIGTKEIFHKTVYDFESLRRILELVGFKNVRRYDWKVTEPQNHITKSMIIHKHIYHT